MGLVSKQCVEFVKKFEGFYPNPYYDIVGVKTLGYGMTGKEIEGLSYVTEAQASQMLENLLNNTYALPLKRDLDKKGVKLNQNQFDALVSMAYNVGVGGVLGSTLYKNICNGVRDKATITSNFEMWSMAGGKQVYGLLRRRREEAAMFLGSGNISSSSTSTGGSYYNVKEVQQMLIKIGYPCGSYGADGAWGNGTKTAVEAFQRDCKLKVDGWVGDNTYAKIKAEYNKKMGIKQEEKKEEEKKVKTLVTYYYPLDQRAAEYVADKLNCPTLFSKRNFDYSCVETIIAVGGNESNYKECNCKPQKIIAGTNRYDTLKAVLDYIK